MIPVHPAFDRLLGGGVKPGVLTHIYGPPASGKTNFAIMASVAACREGKVIYLDPEGGFSVERFRQIAGDETRELLKNIILMQPTSFDEQKVAVERLDEVVPQNDARLVVVDSIAILYRLKEDKDIRELGRMLAKLLRIARRYSIPVLMTNQVYVDIDSKRIVPVGGSINEYWSKVMIELVYEQGVREAVLKKHLHLPEGLRLRYRITEPGIEAVGGVRHAASTGNPP